MREYKRTRRVQRKIQGKKLVEEWTKVSQVVSKLPEEIQDEFHEQIADAFKPKMPPDPEKDQLQARVLELEETVTQQAIELTFLQATAADSHVREKRLEIENRLLIRQGVKHGRN